MLNGSYYNHWRVNEVTVSGLPGLFSGEFSSYDAQGPNVDVTRENPSGPNAHDGFHTIHRLYMAAAFRILRAKHLEDAKA